MVAIWPSDLPNSVLRAGYSDQIPDGRMRSKMSTGPAKVRRLTTSMPRSISVGLLLNTDQRERLLQFWDDDLRGGTLVFWLRDQVSDARSWDAQSDGASLGPVLSEDEAPILIDSWWLCRIGEGGVAYEPAEIPGSWIASFTLEVLP